MGNSNLYRAAQAPGGRALLGLAVLFALCLSWLPVWVGMKVRTPGAVQGIMFLLVLPLSFASNVFVEATSLPGWMQRTSVWSDR
jgi:oleandomycin transport system permease protein